LTLIQSLLIAGPTGIGKSTFARGALIVEGGGLVCAMPGHDELDSYEGVPNVTKEGFDDTEYVPTVDPKSKPNGLRDALTWLGERLREVQADKKAGVPTRYPVVVMDTISAAGQLASNMTLSKFNLTAPPAAISPDGASFYGYLRSRQEEFLRAIRAFRGYGCHVICLTHVGDTEVGADKVAKTSDIKSRMQAPLVPGAFKLAMPSYFSTVLSMGVTKGEKGRQHYLLWEPNETRITKSRLGSLGKSGRILLSADPVENWNMLKRLTENAIDNQTQSG
jgi:AAA domain-containing protein